MLSLAALPWAAADAGTTATPLAPPRAVAEVPAAPARDNPVASALPPAPAGAVLAALPAHTLAEAGVSRGVLELALTAVRCGIKSGDLRTPKTLTLIDYSKPSTEPRLWVFDMTTGALLYRELVAHGRNSGENMATAFSDTVNSRQSSIGLFRTADTYVGSNGYSLRLDGLEPGFNSRARERAIVMHGASYVSAEFARAQGRLGRSWGCPALREAIAREVIDTIRGGDVVFSYYPDQRWLTTSRFLNCDEKPSPAPLNAAVTSTIQ